MVMPNLANIPLYLKEAEPCNFSQLWVSWLLSLPILNKMKTCDEKNHRNKTKIKIWQNTEDKSFFFQISSKSEQESPSRLDKPNISFASFRSTGGEGSGKSYY